MSALLAANWVTDHPMPAIVAGLIALVVGADLLVRGAVWIAMAFGMSRMTVGLTLVAMGTSMPELLVSLTAARTGRNEIAMANVIGSNAANSLLIVGIAAAICAIRLKVRWMELGYSLVATLLVSLPFVFGFGIERPLAGVMLAMLIVFCGHLLVIERSKKDTPSGGHPQPTIVGWVLHVLLLGGGLVALMYGADWLVEGAVVVATSFGLSEALIGMTIVAIGTSLPELATSVVAALKRQPEICVGNVIGSNIFNIGAVLGIAGLIQPFPVDREQLWRLMAVTAISAIALVAVLRARNGVPRLFGILFVLAYVGFLACEIMVFAPG